MFLIIALVLLVLWIFGGVLGLGLAVAGSFIHLLLVLAIIALIWHFVSGRRGAAL
jgi:uncharacterized membrane protein YqjE